MEQSWYASFKMALLRRLAAVRSIIFSTPTSWHAHVAQTTYPVFGELVGVVGCARAFPEPVVIGASDGGAQEGEKGQAGLLHDCDGLGEPRVSIDG